MNMNKTILLSSALLITTSLFAETQTTKATPSYGDNPNLIKVLAVKTQEKVQSTAEKVGAATERGIAKIKPAVDSTWNGTKDYTTEQATIARDNTRAGIDTAVKKVQQTKENIVGTSGPNNVPIERGSLSQSNVQPAPAYIPPQITNDATHTQPAPTYVEKLEPSQTTTTTEAEIQRQSLPIQSTPAQAPHSIDDTDSGLPR